MENLVGLVLCVHINFKYPRKYYFIGIIKGKDRVNEEITFKKSINL